MLIKTIISRCINIATDVITVNIVTERHLSRSKLNKNIRIALWRKEYVYFFIGLALITMLTSVAATSVAANFRRFH